MCTVMSEFRNYSGPLSFRTLYYVGDFIWNIPRPLQSCLGSLLQVVVVLKRSIFSAVGDCIHFGAGFL